MTELLTDLASPKYYQTDLCTKGIKVKITNYLVSGWGKIRYQMVMLPRICVSEMVRQSFLFSQTGFAAR